MVPAYAPATRPPCVALAIHVAEAELRAAVQPVLVEAGLSYGDYLLIEALRNVDGTTPASLARHIRSPLGVVRFQVRGLVEAGYLEVDGEEVWLTPEAVAVHRRAAALGLTASMGAALNQLHLEAGSLGD